MPVIVSTSSPVTLADFKNYLNLTANTGPGGDTELQGFLDTATALLSWRVGGINPTPVVETHHGGSPVIVLNQPIMSVTSVVEWISSMSWTLTEQDYANTPALSAYGFSVEQPQTLTRRTMGYAGRWAPGRDNIIVSYMAGFLTLPPPLATAIKEFAKILFKSQSGSRTGGGQPAQPTAATESFGAGQFPPSVLRLIAPYDNNAVIA